MSWSLLLLDLLLLIENISSKMNREGIILLQSVLFSEDNLEFSRLSKGRLDHSLHSVLGNHFQSDKLGITSLSQKMENERIVFPTGWTLTPLSRRLIPITSISDTTRSTLAVRSFGL